MQILIGGVITEAGAYTVKEREQGRDFIMELAGDFGGGTVTPGYDDGAGGFVPYRDPLGQALCCSEPQMFQVIAPQSRRLAVKVEAEGPVNVRVTVTRRRLS